MDERTQPLGRFDVTRGPGWIADDVQKTWENPRPQNRLARFNISDFSQPLRAEERKQEPAAQAQAQPATYDSWSQVEAQRNAATPRPSMPIMDVNGDGIPDGAEITRRTTGADGSITVAKWTKGRRNDFPMMADTPDRRNTSFPMMGDTPASMSPYRSLSPSAQARIFGGARTVEDQRDWISGQQQRRDRFAIMKDQNYLARDVARYQAWGQKPEPDAPRPVGFSGGVALPDPSAPGGYRAQFQPPQPAEASFSPDGKTIRIPDQRAPGGFRFEAAPKPAPAGRFVVQRDRNGRIEYIVDDSGRVEFPPSSSNSDMRALMLEMMKDPETSKVAPGAGLIPGAPRG